MRNFFFVIAFIFTCVLLFIGTVSVYKTPQNTTSPLERYRLAFDEYSRAQFISRNSLFMFAHVFVFGNSDKYAYRPPRIIPTHTFQGQRAVKVYALVANWEAQTKLLELELYTGKHVFVRFDPSADGSMAFMPKIDNWGRMQESGENDIITDSANERFASLFCVGDIVEIVALKPSDLMHSDEKKPIIPKEIKLSQRLCSQN